MIPPPGWRQYVFWLLGMMMIKFAWMLAELPRADPTPIPIVAVAEAATLPDVVMGRPYCMLAAGVMDSVAAGLYSTKGPVKRWYVVNPDKSITPLMVRIRHDR